VRDGETKKVSAGERTGRRRTRVFVDRGGVLDALKRWRRIHGVDADCYRWRGDDEVNDRPVGKPQEEGMMNIAASFSLSKKPRFIEPVGKSQYT
jgi:hypothetical protein